MISDCYSRRIMAPDHEFVAYIDEAGDPSLKRVRPIDAVGSTEWFAISAVVVGRHNDDKTTQWVAAINREIGAPNSQIIHFKDLSSHDRLRVAQHVSNLPLRIFVVASNKKNVRRYKNARVEAFNTKQWFYNWMARILIERVTDYCYRRAIRNDLSRRHVKFVFSQTGGHSYSQTSAYHELLKHQSRSNKLVLTKRSPRWEVMHHNLVENFPHYKRAGLQLADVAASSFYQAIDNLDTGPCVTDYAIALSPKVAMDEQERKHDYGVVLQPTPDWEAQISEDQRAIFRHYGYTFTKKW